MQALEYLVITSALFFIVTFCWLLNVSGLFDCLKTSPIKSAFHCLSLITTQCDQVLAKSSRKVRQRPEEVTQANSSKFKPARAIHWGLTVQLGNK